MYIFIKKTHPLRVVIERTASITLPQIEKWVTSRGQAFQV